MSVAVLAQVALALLEVAENIFNQIKTEELSDEDRTKVQARFDAAALRWRNRPKPTV